MDENGGPLMGLPGGFGPVPILGEQMRLPMPPVAEHDVQFYVEAGLNMGAKELLPPHVQMGPGSDDFRILAFVVQVAPGKLRDMRFRFDQGGLERLRESIEKELAVMRGEAPAEEVPGVVEAGDRVEG